MEILEKLLIDLNSTIDSTETVLDAHLIALNIESYVHNYNHHQQQIDSNELEYLLFLLTQSEYPPNLLHFIQGTMRTKVKEFIKAKCTILKFMGSLIKSIGREVGDYGITVCNTCIDVFRMDDSNEVKAASLEPPKQLLHLCLNGYQLDCKDLDLDRLYELLLSEYSGKKSTGGVRYQCLAVLGHIVAVYPHNPATISNVEMVKERCVLALQKNFSAACRSPDLTLIAGAFGCLDRTCGQYEDGIGGNVEVWRYLVKAISGVKQESLHRYAMVGKALRFIKHHSGLFRELIGVNFSTSYEMMVACFFSEKSVCKKHAEEALVALLGEYAAYLCENDTEDLASLRTVVEGLMGYLKDVGMARKDVVLAVRGLTALAPAMCIYSDILDRDTDIVNTLVATCDHLMLEMSLQDGSQESTGNGLVMQHTPLVLLRKAQFLSAVVVNIKRSTPTFALRRFLVTTATDLVIGYSRLWGESSAAVQSALRLFMCAFMSPDNRWNGVADTVVPCLMVRAMSRPVDGESVDIVAIDPITGEGDGRLHLKYAYLWKELLYPGDRETRKTGLWVSGGEEGSNAVDRKLVQSFLAEVAKTLSTLELSYTTSNEGLVEVSAQQSEDIAPVPLSASLIPGNPADQELILNLVAFLEDTERSIARHIQQQCSEIVTQQLASLVYQTVDLAYEWPMVSALYRFIRVLSALCNVKKIVTDGVKDALIQCCASVAVRIMNDFSHPELVSSALYMVFSAPPCILLALDTDSVIVPLVTRSLATTLRPKLAMLVLELLLYNNRLSNRILDLVLPQLQKYLIHSECSRTGVERGGTSRKRSKEGLEVATEASVYEEGEMQISVLRFLGRLGGRNKALLPSPEATVATSLSWGSFQRSLKVPLPVVYNGELGTNDLFFPLGSCMSRVVELCMDRRPEGRQMRVLAAETLHSMLIVLIGQAASDISNDVQEHADILQQVLPCILSMAGSSELVVRNLFEKLLYQMVHWLAGTDSRLNCMGVVLLDSLVDGLACSTSSSGVENSQTKDVGMRETCTAALVEMFRWIQRSTASTSQMNLDNIILRLLSLSVHPDTDKRLGAAGVLNRLYIYVREDRMLVMRYALRFIFSLLNAVKTGGSSQEACALAVRRYVNIVVKFSSHDESDAAMLRRGRWENASDSSFSYARDEAHESQQPCFPYTLRDLLQWLWSGVSSEDYVFRRQCMACLGDLCALVPLPDDRNRPTVTPVPRPPHLQSVAEYIHSLGPDTESCVVEVSRVLSGSLKTVSRPSTTLLSETDNPVIETHSESWMRTLSGALDGCNWILTCLEAFSPEDLFLSAGKDMPVMRKRKREREVPLPLTGSEGSESNGKILLIYLSRIFRFCARQLLGQCGTEQYLDGEIITEVLRRSLQLLLVLVKHSVNNTQLSDCLKSNGLLSSDGRLCHSFQLILISSLCSIPLRLSYDGGQKMTHEAVVLLDSMATSLVDEGQLVSKLPDVISISSIYASRGGRGGNYEGGLGHLLTTVETFLGGIGDMCNEVLTPTLWCTLLTNCLNTLSSKTAATYLMALDRCFGVLKRCALLPFCFGDSYQYDLVARGGNLVHEAMLLSDGFESTSDALLRLGVTMGVCISGQKQSLLNTVLLNAADDNHILQRHGKTVVDVVLVDSDGSGLRLYSASVLDELVRTSISLREVAKQMVMKLTSIVAERVESILVENLAIFVEQMARRVVGDKDFRSLLCSEELVSALLYLESRLPLTVRMDSTSSLGSTLVSFRDLLLESVLQVFEACGRSSGADVTTAVIRGDNLCDCIVRGFSMLSYLIPGTIKSCPRPFISSSAPNYQIEIEKEIEQKVTSALEEVVASKFPLNSTSLDRNSDGGKEFSRIFKAWLDCFSHCGAMCLLEPLSPTLREGKAHAYSSWISTALSSFVTGMADSGESNTEVVMYVCSVCLSTVLDPYKDMSVKLMYFDDLCVPMLISCSSSTLVTLCCTTSSTLGSGDILVKQLVNVISSNGNIIASLSDQSKSMDDQEGSLLRALCAYTIIGALYDRCSVEDVKGPVTEAFSGKGASGKELTQAVCRAAHKLVRQTPPRSLFPETSCSVVQRLQSAAFNCLLMVVAKTQMEEQFFDAFVFKEKSQAPDQQFWGNVVDCTLRLSFKEATFKTAHLGGWMVRERRLEDQSFSSLPTLSTGGLLTQHLRSSSQLLSRSNLKRVHTQSQSTSQYMLSRSQSHGTMTESPSDPFLSLSQANHAINDGVLPYKGGGRSSDYDLTTTTGGLVQGLDDCIIALEMNPVNAQQCMGPLVRVIYRMHVLFQDRWSSLDSSENNLPFWLRVVRDKLSDYSPLPMPRGTVELSHSHDSERRNLRVFMLRLLLNQPVTTITTPFVHLLMKPILDCCLYDLCGVRHPSVNQASAEEPFHYMIRDVIFTIVDSWPGAFRKACELNHFLSDVSDECPLQHRTVVESAVSFLSYLLRHAYPAGDETEEFSDMARDNIGGVCALIRLWVGDNLDNGARIRNGLDLNPLIQLITAESAPTGGAHGKVSSKGTRGVRRRLCGLELLLCLAQQGYPIISDSADEGGVGEKILAAVSSGCKYPRKEVSELSGSVAGALLRCMMVRYTPSGMQDSVRLVGLESKAEKFSKEVECRLMSLLSMKNGPDSVACCVRAITKQYPSFLSREMLLRLFSVFSSMKPRARADFLETLCDATSATETGKDKLSGICILDQLRPYLASLLSDISTVAFGRGIGTRNLPMIQILALRLMRIHSKDSVRLNLLSAGSSNGVAESVAISRCVDESAVLEVRQEAYVLLMTLHTTIVKALRGTSESSNLTAQLGTARVLLMRGLTDADDGGEETQKLLKKTEAAADTALILIRQSGIKKTVFDYFESNFGISTCPIERLSALMTDFFDPTDIFTTDPEKETTTLRMEASEHWLRYSAYLLLGSAVIVDSMGSGKKLFSRGLATEDTFTPMEVTQSSTVSQFHTGSSGVNMSPMFAIENTQPQLYSGSKRNIVRGTQQLKWTQTQSQDTLEGARNSTQEKAFFTQMQAAPMTSQATSAHGMGPPTGLPNYVSSTQSQSQGTWITQRVPMRYRRNSVPSSEGGQQHSLESRARRGAYRSPGMAYSSVSHRTQKLRQDRLRRAARVTVFRRYRDGELPDICIELNDVTKPLQALCLRDPATASLIFRSLFCELFDMAAELNVDQCETIRFALWRMLGGPLTSADNGTVRHVLSDNTLASAVLAASRHCLLHELKTPVESAALSAIPPLNVGNTAVASTNIHSGALFLEDQLLVQQHRSKANTRDEITVAIGEGGWVELARMYGALQEHDMLVGLFFQISRLEDTKRALDAEVQGNYPLAVELYNKLIAASEGADLNDSGPRDWGDVGAYGALDVNSEGFHPNQQEKEMWCKRSLECLRQLLDWGQLYDKVDTISSGEEDKEDCVIERLLSSGSSSWLLPYYTSCLAHLGGMAISYGADGVQTNQGPLWNETVDFLRVALQTSTSTGEHLKRFLEDNHPSEIAVCYLSIGDTARAQSYASMAFTRFLESWSTVHPCALAARGALLSGLQQVVELEDAVSLLRERAISQNEDVLGMWSKSLPSYEDALWVWDGVSRVREVSLMTRLQKDKESGSDYHLVPTLELLGRYHVDMAITAVLQEKMQVVKSQLGISHSIRRALTAYSDRSRVKTVHLSMPEVRTVYEYNKKSIGVALQGGCEEGSDVWNKVVPMYEKTMTLLQKKYESCGPSDDFYDTVVTRVLQGEWLASWGRFLRECGNREWEKKINGAFDALKDVTSVLDSCREQPRGIENECAYGKFARQCDDILNLHGTSGTLGDKEKVAQVAIDVYIKGLQRGDALCRSRLLNLFSLVGRYVCSCSNTESSERLVNITRQVTAVPSWVFLKNSAQIMALIDRPEGELALAVLEHMARLYPRALYYPFKVTYPNLSLEGQTKAKVLSGLVADELVDKFVEALGGLTHPELRWSDGVKRVAELFRLKKGKEAEEYHQELVAATTSTEWELVGTKIGAYNMRFARYMAKKRVVAGTRGSGSQRTSQSRGRGSSSSCNVGLSSGLVDELLEESRDLSSGGRGWSMRFSSGKVPVTEFSEWLADLGPLLLSMSSSSLSHQIEVPGQYSNCEREPMVNQHATILSVGPELLVMSSIRKPKRLSILSSTGEEVKFLVKGGEDLRNDERIEQLFMLMNTIVTSHRSSEGGPSGGKRDRLRARTFSVIPMTPKVGVLEWVPNTVPLKSIVSEEMALDSDFLKLNPGCLKTGAKSVDLSSIVASKKRLDWLKGSYQANDYHTMFVKAKAEHARTLWKKIARTTPQDYLRRRFIRMSPSPEVFLTLRSECAISLAVSSIFGYILGIGDRHLDNLLIDIRAGSVVQIDFGICFGMGASVLPVPELIPFRLTGQLRSLFTPLDGTNLLRHYMVETLSGIRGEDGRSALCNALEVYVNDPVVDWLKGSVTKAEMETVRDDVKWEPRRRIANAMRKLEGVHPVDLLIEDLQLNNSVRRFGSLDALARMLQDAATGGVRYKKGIKVDTNSQVDALVSLSTDPNLLVRHWSGLMTWI